jgi:hypothetical protein
VLESRFPGQEKKFVKKFQEGKEGRKRGIITFEKFFKRFSRAHT